jgi:RimJ/RimL family protein N-acetyltransferase
MATYQEVQKSLKDGTEALVRNALITDALPFLTYAQKVFATSQYLITEADEFVPDLKKHEQAIQSLQDSTGSLFLLVLVKGEIVGNLDFKSTETRRRLAHRGSFGMSVASQFRGQGVGRILLEALIDWAKRADNPIEKIELGVLSDNSPAIELYQKLGFQKEGLIRNAAKLTNNRYLDEVQMGLVL